MFIDMVVVVDTSGVGAKKVHIDVGLTYVVEKVDVDDKGEVPSHIAVESDFARRETAKAF